MAPPSPKSTAEEVRGLTFAPTLTPSERITLFLSHLTNTPYSGFDKRLIREELQLVSAGPTECVFELTVTPRLADRAGNLHVGAATLLFDVCTTSAMIPRARKGFWQLLGVTRNLSVTTIRPAPVGSELVVESRVVAAEGRLATIVGVIRDKRTQEVVSMVEHLKVDSGPQESKL